MKSKAIKQVVAKYYKVNLGSKGRQVDLVRPRQIAQYLCCKYTSLNLSQIARSFNLDHTTIIHNCRVIEQIIAKENCEIADEIINQIDEILGILRKSEDGVK
jgi:chromosomal replication initiator protein